MRYSALLSPIVRLLALPMVLGCANLALGDTITFGGSITQSTSDGTGPAMNNPDLNNILDGDQYVVTLDFAGSITAPGTYNLAGAVLTFVDETASPQISETSFNSVSFSVVPDGSRFDLSMLGCLSTGSGCLLGNELAVNFSIPAAGLNQSNVVAQAIFGLNPPVDLLEDDGVTDIQGSVSSYSYSGVPEPSSLGMLVLFVAGMISWHSRRGSKSVFTRV